MARFFPLRLIPEKTNIDFLSIKKMSIAFSIFCIFASLCLVFWKGFNLGIDFIGGVVIDVRLETKPDLALLRHLLGELRIGEVILQSFDDGNALSIKVAASTAGGDVLDTAEKIKDALTRYFNGAIEYRKVDLVGPQIGSELIGRGVYAVSLAFAAIAFYVWVRFGWRFGFGVLIALIHDAILSLGFMSLTAYDFNLSTVAAILIIIGYSVNDSVVIYDRIRENLLKYPDQLVSDIINLSINETLSRTIITVFTTLLANFALIMWGGEAIRSFSVLVFFGVFIGTLSSIFVSAPVLVMLGLVQMPVADSIVDEY